MTTEVERPTEEIKYVHDLSSYLYHIEAKVKDMIEANEFANFLRLLDHSFYNVTIERKLPRWEDDYCGWSIKIEYKYDSKQVISAKDIYDIGELLEQEPIKEFYKKLRKEQRVVKNPNHAEPTQD